MGLCKDGYWRETEFYDGKKYTASGKTQKAAIKSLSQKIADAKNGVGTLNKNTTVRVWADIWLDTYIKHLKMTDKSYATYEQTVGKYIRPNPLGGMKLSDVKETHLQKILNEQEGTSFSHASKLRMIMKQMFHKAFRQHLINFDPAEDLALPDVDKNKRRCLTADERSAVLKTAQTHYAGPWVLTMLYCGLRPGETIALQWKDIDFQNQKIKISAALESGKADKFKAPKTAAGTREVPMPKALVDALRPLAGGPFEYVFTQVLNANKGKHHTESSLNCYWNNFKRQLDIDMGATVYRNQIIESKVDPDLTAYYLRHTYCTDLQTAGVPLNIAKALMGHDDVTVTANIYTHSSPDGLRAAAKKIDKLASKNRAG